MKKLFAALAIGLLLSLSAHAANPVVEMKTSQGLIVIELDAAKAPKTVENFLLYVKDGFYNGTLFHRIIDGVMIQGGGYARNLREKPRCAQIQNEAKTGLKNVIGTIAMARTPNPHSAAAQFFINVADNGFLDYPGQDGWGYAVFGKVTKGMDVVHKIAKAKKGRQDIPVEPIVIESVRLVEAKPATK